MPGSTHPNLMMSILVMWSVLDPQTSESTDTMKIQSPLIGRTYAPQDYRKQDDDVARWMSRAPSACCLMSCDRSISPPDPVYVLTQLRSVVTGSIDFAGSNTCPGLESKVLNMWLQLSQTEILDLGFEGQDEGSGVILTPKGQAL